MEPIEYTEKIVEAALKEVRASYDALHERSYKFATLSLGAAGAVSIYALGKIGTPDSLWQVLPMAFLAVWWFGVASILLLKGAATNEMSAGTTSKSIRERIEKHAKVSTGESDLAHGLHLTRWDQAAGIDAQIKAFSDANIVRAEALDDAYKWIVSSPLAGLAGLLLAYGMR